MRHKLLNTALLFLLLILSIGCIGNADSEKKARELEERLIKLEQQNEGLRNQIEVQPDIRQNRPDNSLGKTKYAFVVIKTKEPILDYRPISGKRSEDGVFKVNWEEYIYKSKVISIENYDENEKYKLMDEVSEATRQQFIYKDMSFLSSMPHNNIGDIDRHERKRRELSQNKCKIVDRDCFVFDSYREASENREKY